LVTCLADQDQKTRRNAIIARCKLPGSADALLARWPKESSVELLRSLAQALGKSGDARALPLLSACDANDAELKRIVSEALLKLQREHSRQQPSAIASERTPSRRFSVWAHCRDGLESLVCQELRSSSPRVIEPTRVALSLDGALTTLFRSRCLMRFGFPLPTGKSRAPADALVHALTS